ncbi:MAG: TlpA family protein disulfide reductase [Phycisphaerales bacterium]
MKHLAALVVLIGSLVGSVALADDLKADGAFGFPQKDATVLCDTPTLRVSAVSDREHVYVQAIIWTDNDATVGQTDDGRDIGDWSNLDIDADGDGKITPQVDRSYALNPWPKLAGLHYSVKVSDRGSTGLQGDSKGRGSIQYVDHAGTKVRVDNYLVPIAELGAKPGGTIRLAYWGSSPTPKLVVNSVGFESKKAYYAHSLPREKYHTVAVADRAPVIDSGKVPEGRGTIAVEAKTESPKVGAVPPPVASKDWINWKGKEAPTLDSLKGKVVVIEFWATWCAPCVAGIPHLNKVHDEYSPKGLVILSLTDQATDHVRKFMEKREMRYVVGTGSATGQAYGVEGIPHAVIINKEGTVAWIGHPADPAFDETIARLIK